ncbi:uncharacterized protein FYW61_001268 isoform 2-T3 [Anableps anableps]
MHRHTERHAFAPLLTRPQAYPLMGHQDRNFSLQPPRQTQRPYFGHASAFQRATQKYSSSAIRRSKSLHVCIAWRIYYHKQLKKTHQKSSSLPQEMLLKLHHLPHSEKPKEPKPSCRHPYLDSAFRSTAGREKEANVNHNWSELPKPYPSKPAFHLSHETQQDNLSRENVKHPVEKMDVKRHKSCQTNTTLSLPVWDKSWAPRMIHDGKQCSSLDGRRHQEDCMFDDVKRLKQETEDKKLDPSSFTGPYTEPSIHKIQVQQISISSLCVSCCSGNRSIISYPGTELHPYQTASWERIWNHRMDVHLRQKVFKGYFCDRFHPFLAPYLHSPLALRSKDTVYFPDQDTFLSPQ